MIVQITQSGRIRREYVEQAEFVVRCHYALCGKEFLTIDPDKMYCREAHRTSAWRQRWTGALVTAPYTIK